MTISKIFLISWFITRFEPIEWFIDWIFKPSLFKDRLKTLMTCIKCTSFWVGLMLTHGGIYIAILSSLLAMFYDKTIGEWEKKIKWK